MASVEEFNSWEAGAREVWERVAPSYVQHDVTLKSVHLYDLFHAGATVSQFEDALEDAFATKTVRQRAALYHAYALVRRQLNDEVK